MIVLLPPNRYLTLPGRDDDDGPSSGSFEIALKLSSWYLNVFQACTTALTRSVNLLNPASLLLERVLVQLVRHPGVHQRGDVVDLLVLPFLQQLAVPVSVLEGYRVPHRPAHQCLVEEQDPLAGEQLELAERDGLGPGTLRDLFDAERAVLRLPPDDEFLGVVRVEAERPDVVLIREDETLKILVNLHHVQHGPVENVQASLCGELVVLHPGCGRQFQHRQARDVASGLNPERSVGYREEEGESTEVVALRQVGSHSTRHPPELALAVRDGLLVGEEVRVPLHRDPESLGQDVIAG